MSHDNDFALAEMFAQMLGGRSMPSRTMRSTVIVGAIASPVFRSVRPAPRWSHCTIVKCFSQVAKYMNDQGYVGISRTAVEEQQNRIVAIPASNADPLVNAAYRNIGRYRRRPLMTATAYWLAFRFRRNERNDSRLRNSSIVSGAEPSDVCAIAFAIGGPPEEARRLAAAPKKEFRLIG